jgi:hypothetical protein
MEETQMTDSELVKALENSINTYNEKGVYVDTENLQQQVLDLIKRQRAEIERLEKARQRQDYLSCNLRGQKYELMNRISVVKNEAYKEFAERLKSYLLLNKKGEMSVISFENVDNLLKEMVGEDR